MVSTPQHRDSAATMMGTSAEHYSRSRAEPASWHPKLTPYRLIIITTTVAFGTAKAILTPRQSVETSVTLEWLLGTLISLLIFVVSSYDSRQKVPPCLHWLFKPDCMDSVWALLWTCFSIKRPNYTSEERTALESEYWDRPSITPYRILVCTTVTSVGMSKAMLGYYGLSTDVTWTDWALGVPLTMILYCLGLYEYNSSDVWHTFFVSDQTHVFYSLSTLIIETLRLSACVAWLTYWGFAFRDVTYNPKWDMSTPRPEGFKPTIKTFFEDMADWGIKLLIQEFILAAIFGGLVVCLLVVRRFVVKTGLIRALRWARHWMESWMSMGSPASDLSTRQTTHPLSMLLGHTRRVAFIILHTALHLIGLVIIGTFTMLTAGFTVTFHDYFRPTGRDIICLTAPYFIPMMLGFVTAGLLFAQARILFSMLFPFWRWLSNSVPIDNFIFDFGRI